MKQFLTCITIITVFFCKAQIIIPLDNIQPYENNPNYYTKDVNNELDQFEGLWKYSSGNTDLVLRLKKEEHYQSLNSSEYQDLLTGEYKLIENGTLRINTLTDFYNPNINGYDHAIFGDVFIHVLPDFCIDNSNISEIKIKLTITHPTDEYVYGHMILRYVNDNGTEKLQACIYDYTTLGDTGVRLDIPDGYYEFIKE